MLAYRQIIFLFIVIKSCLAIDISDSNNSTFNDDDKVLENATYSEDPHTYSNPGDKTMICI